MFCMDCGKFLPDGAKFCAFCGKPQPQLSSNPPVPPTYAEPPQPVQTSGGLDDLCWKTQPAVMGCSEKQENLVYAPGWGVYFIRERNLFSFCERDGKLRQITRSRQEWISYWGLNYWNGEIFYWAEREEGQELIAVKVGSHEKRTVRLKPADGQKRDYVPTPDSQDHFYVRNGVGYGIFQSYLYTLDMNTGRYQLKELPDLQTQELPEEWVKEGALSQSMELHPEERNYGRRWYGLYIQGQYGYTAMVGYILYIVRFSLEDPSQFTHMPVDCATVVRDMGMISEYDGGPGGRRMLLGEQRGRYGVRNGGKCISITEFMQDGSMKSWNPVSLKMEDGERLESRYWWRAGDRYVIEDLLLNMKTLKKRRLPVKICANDFMEVAGRIYLLCDDLYCLPGNFDEVIKSEEDLNRYIVAKLE